MHREEPWKVVTSINGGGYAIDNEDGRKPYIADFLEKDDAERIVECVNALKGIGLVQEWADDKRGQYVDLLAIKQRLHAKTGECHLLTGQRHELLSALKGIIDYCTMEHAEYNGWGPQRMKVSEVYDRIMWGTPNEGGGQ